MKDFAVIGLGNFGATVARELTKLKCRVTAIDVDKARVQNLDEDVDTAIVGNAADRSFLDNIEVDKFDCFIVSTGENTHASILITLFLKELGAETIIVKARSNDHAKILTKVGASMTIIPEQDMAIRVAHSQAQSNLIDYLPLTDEYVVAEFDPPRKFVNKTLMELKLRGKYNIQLIAVKDIKKDRFNFAPDGQYRITKDDVLVALGRREDIDSLKD